jgi:hypothetical protein
MSGVRAAEEAGAAQSTILINVSGQVLLLAASIIRPCFLSLLYGMLGLWLVSGGQATQVAVAICGLSAGVGFVAGIAAQIVAASSGLDATWQQILEDAVAFAPWSSTTSTLGALQLLSDLMAIVACGVLHSAAKRRRDVLWSLFAKSAGKRGGWGSAMADSLFSIACVCALLASSICVRTLLHLPYFMLGLTSMVSWAFRCEGWLFKRYVCVAVLTYCSAHLLLDYAVQIPILRDRSAPPSSPSVD